jgi:hypothetical protein
MRATIPTFTPVSVLRWKRIFVAIEIIFVCSFSMTLFFDRFFNDEPGLWPASILIVCLTSLAFLLFVGPFFVPHFRRVAIIGWLMALAALVYGLSFVT